MHLHIFTDWHGVGRIFLIIIVFITNYIINMKRILTIILAAFAIAACDPNENKSAEFEADALISTAWKGTLQSIQSGAVSNSAEVTVKFNSADTGQLIQKRSGAPSKDYYDMTYRVSGKKIIFDCPVISGTWEVSGYMEQAMTLTLLPSRNSIMTLVRQ